MAYKSGKSMMGKGKSMKKKPKMTARGGMSSKKSQAKKRMK